ncbi:hypothetical protein, partial [Clavibacter michiganensis]|uniref:hypothetical protein n=1 Tax=Clavibacter michiganensis TaxID=28447 RepID=UPI002930908B
MRLKARAPPGEAAREAEQQERLRELRRDGRQVAPAEERAADRDEERDRGSRDARRRGRRRAPRLGLLGARRAA